MTMSEVAVWSEYRKKRGSFNVSLRVEEGFAHVQSAIYGLVSKERIPAERFMPHVVPPEADKPEDVTEVLSLLKGLAVKSDVAEKYRQRRAMRNK